MEKNNNKQQENAKEVKPQTDAKLSEKQSVARSKFLLVWLAIIILLGLLAGSFWFFQQQLLKQQQLEPVAQTQSTLSTKPLENKIGQLEQAFNADTAKTEQRLAGLSAANIALLDKVDELAKTQQLTNDDVLRSWNLAELKFLLQSANQSALLAGNVDKAQAALTLADQQLKSLIDPRLHELRALIADEKLALASVVKVDIAGLAMKLQSALDKVDDLQVLMGPQLSSQKAKDSTADSSSSVSWKTALSQAWQEIKSLVVIRHQQDAAVAVLVPEQRYFLYQNLRLKLESARLGLLSTRDAVFHDNLTSAEQWLQQYFIGTERDAMLEMLAAMQPETISVEVPDISASLIWLQNYGDQQ
jgi:uroporphyrin-3 C-methyltransferase